MNNQPGNRFPSLLESSAVPLLSDGAMGTLLNARGLNFDECLDAAQSISTGPGG